MSTGAAAAPQMRWRPYVPVLVKLLSAVCIGILLGLSLTLFVVERRMGFGTIELGAWRGLPRAGTPLDPYTRAALAYSGETPLSASDAITFIAREDSTRRALTPFCDYSISGDLPAARYWTLTLLTPAGAPAPNLSGRAGFTSSEVLRASGGTFQITVSRHARPGNWLPAGEGAFVLVLRLYDSELAANSGPLAEASMPRIARGRCG
jgi:hypothetical protein